MGFKYNERRSLKWIGELLLKHCNWWEGQARLCRKLEVKGYFGVTHPEQFQNPRTKRSMKVCLLRDFYMLD